MEKTILLGVNDQFSPKTTKWLYLLIGVCFLANGLINFYSLYSGSYSGFAFFLAPVMLLGGVYYVFMFATAFSEHSRFAPKVRLTKEAIQFKKDVFATPFEISWQEVKNVELQSYKINFEGVNSSYSIRYQTIPQISLEVKQIIRTAAENKGIPVYDG